MTKKHLTKDEFNESYKRVVVDSGAQSIADNLTIDKFKCFTEFDKLVEIHYDRVDDVVKHISKLKGFTEHEKLLIAFKVGGWRK